MRLQRECDYAIDAVQSQDEVVFVYRMNKYTVGVKRPTTAPDNIV
jgi:hypothetical protein